MVALDEFQLRMRAVVPQAEAAGQHARMPENLRRQIMDTFRENLAVAWNDAAQLVQMRKGRKRR
jgi:hypothetical protein